MDPFLESRGVFSGEQGVPPRGEEAVDCCCCCVPMCVHV